MDTYIRAVTTLSRVAGVIAAFLIGAAVLIICEMVIVRDIFDRSTIWQIDAVTYSIIASTFIGSAYVLMTRGHVNVDVLPLQLGPRARFGLALFTTILAFGFCLVLLWLCTSLWYESWIKDWHSDTIWRAPLWIPYFSMPVGLSILCLQYAAELLCLVTGRSPPFGISDKAEAREIAREQARDALGGAG